MFEFLLLWGVVKNMAQFLFFIHWPIVMVIKNPVKKFYLFSFARNKGLSMFLFLVVSKDNNIRKHCGVNLLLQEVWKVWVEALQLVFFLLKFNKTNFFKDDWVLTLEGLHVFQNKTILMGEKWTNLCQYIQSLSQLR